jgi:hypothetical protein
MTTSDDIRKLARDGLSVADIARSLNIRYQHAYNVIRKSGTLEATVSNIAVKRGDFSISKKALDSKPELKSTELVDCGFVHSSRWLLTIDGQLVLESPMPKNVGVYAFAIAGTVVYVGVATIGLAKRLYFYARPGPTQKTSQRLNAKMKEVLQEMDCIEILTASPEDFLWNGLPVHGSAGLELGLIKKYALPWNLRSAKS